MNTTSKCIMVFGYLGGPSKGVLSIKVITESLDMLLVKSLSSEEYVDDEVEDVIDALEVNQGSGVWVTLFAELPEGIHRVVIEGARAERGLGGLAVDDIKIAECSEFCKYTCLVVLYMFRTTHTLPIQSKRFLYKSF